MSVHTTSVTSSLLCSCSLSGASSLLVLKQKKRKSIRVNYHVLLASEVKFRIIWKKRGDEEHMQVMTHRIRSGAVANQSMINVALLFDSVTGYQSYTWNCRSTMMSPIY